VSEKENKKAVPELDRIFLDNKRHSALRDLCEKYRYTLEKRDPCELARLAALSLDKKENGAIVFTGDNLLETNYISWPELTVTNAKGKPVPLYTEALWLHYLDRADGQPLEGRWVNLSEIGGLFYQQAFQGYCGDALADYWGDNIDGLRIICQALGGWNIKGLADLAFEWRVLPRLPLCLCYRKAGDGNKAWATMLFDASASHYVAADVAATVGKAFSDKLKVNDKGMTL